MKKAAFLLCYTIILAATIYFMFDFDSAADRGSYVNNIGVVTEKIINVPPICQYPELPTGCESVAAAMVLRYYGDDVTPEEFAGSWLTCSEDFYSWEGVQYGPNPNEVFAGNPFTESAYGCFSMPIVNSVNDNSDKCKAESITNISLDELCSKYIDYDRPLLIWATIGMKEPKAGDTWYLQDGMEFTWISGEHCLVLVGYNTEYYFLIDPQVGSVVAYQKSIVQKRFAELGMQAVCIYKSNDT